MADFHISVVKPEDVRARLGDPDRHWVPGYSAFELATSWISAKGVPAAVRRTLDAYPQWKDAQMLDAFFERKTELGTAGFPSQSDLMALMSVPAGRAVVCVEGKVKESFGPYVEDWLAEAKSDNRLRRLEKLCATLAVDGAVCGRQRYQLFHRSAAAIYEAKRFGYPVAMMLVHSFSTAKAWFEEFSAFTREIGLPVDLPNSIAGPKTCEGVEFWIGWVSDQPTVDIERGSKATASR